VVPEKQGLKPKVMAALPFPLNRLSSGSRKTRIETDELPLDIANLAGLSSGSRKTRIETFLGSERRKGACPV